MEEMVSFRGSRFILILLFGILSVICAEVFSGSSPLWMYSVWGLFIVLPLYWGHGLILWNIALRYRKTSLTHLYLLGIIYGLYESWMTKVIWAGYMQESGPQFGQFLGFAIGEFLVIALFWHAVFSFIIPVMAFEILGNRTPTFKKSRVRTTAFGTVIIIASIFIPSGLGYDPIATILAVVTNFALLLSVIFIAKKLNPNGFSLESLRLSKMGLGITIGYTGFLYIFLFFFIFPERIAPPLTIIFTILFYALIIALFKFSEEQTFNEEDLIEGFNSSHVFVGLCVIVVLIFLWFLILESTIPMLLGVLIYLGMVFTGPIMFFLAVFKVMTKRL